LFEAQNIPWWIPRNVIPIRNIGSSPSFSVEVLNESIKQSNEERNHHVNESATGDFSESHLNTSHSLGAEDLKALSNESRLHSAWKHQLQMILEQSLEYQAGLSTTLSLQRPIYRPGFDQKLSSMYLLSNEVMQRHRIFQDFLNMPHSTRFSYERQQDREISTHNDCMITGIFPVKLHRILLKLDQDRGGRDIAHFVPNGKAFVILNLCRFESEVMKEFFPRMSSYASFQKQLNLYDFRRSEKAYYHPSFLREFPSKCIGMKRNMMKKNPKFEC
jgi:hypothetical protein